MTFEFGPDEDIQSLGEFLRSRRQGHDLSLEDVAEKIKIHVKYLTAIEEGKDADLPGHVYKELFLKSYCEFLGISIDELAFASAGTRAGSAEEEDSRDTAAAGKASRPYTPPRRRGERVSESQKNSGGADFWLRLWQFWL